MNQQIRCSITLSDGEHFTALADTVDGVIGKCKAQIGYDPFSVPEGFDLTRHVGILKEGLLEAIIVAKYKS